MTVHFICRGNAFRSLIAEAYLKSLNLPGLIVTSSGTVSDEYFVANRPSLKSTLALLEQHGIANYAKHQSEQLTQQRVDNQDVTVCMNQVVVDEASAIVSLPKNTVDWQITDIGEGSRIVVNGNRQMYEEEIYQEIVKRVNDLVAGYRH